MERDDGVTIRPTRPDDLAQLGCMGERLCRYHHELDPERFFVLDDMAPGYSAWLGVECRSYACRDPVAHKRRR